MLFCSNKFQNFKNNVPFDDEQFNKLYYVEDFIDFAIIFEFADKNFLDIKIEFLP